jgi:hypothetical protein
MIPPIHGISDMYSSMSCIHPMFHLKSKPSPPTAVGRVTIGHDVDSSAITGTPGYSA